MDGGHARTLARRVHETAQDARQVAVRVTGTSAVEWTSTAADEFRARLAGEAERVRRAAALLDAAAAALQRHAAVLDAVGPLHRLLP